MGTPGPRLSVNCSLGLKTVLFLFPLNWISFLIQIYNITHTWSWRIPGTEEPDGLPSMGSHRVGHDWSDLAAHSLQDLTCPTKDWTWAICSGNVETQPLAHQGISLQCALVLIGDEDLSIFTSLLLYLHLLELAQVVLYFSFKKMLPKIMTFSQI